MSQSSMTPEPDRLLARLLEGELPEAEREQLNRLLRDDASLRRLYREYMVLDALLRWEIAPPLMRVGEEGRGMAGSPAINLPDVAAVELPQQLDPESQTPEPRTPNPEPPFPSLSTTNYPLPTTPFVGSWAFSYMVATVVMGVAILGFWAYKITHYQHIAEAPSQSAPSDARPEMVFVGRITGMSGVKWSDDKDYLPPPDFAHVPLDRKYKLDSGLVQITYDSGAKVILEGPCTYEVESTAGGYLSLGKLTARVGEDKETRRQGDKGKKADAASPHLLVSRSPGLPVSPLFSVRTPTAVVTDLGTEFGVEVDESGCSLTHVFQGKVEVRLAGDGNGKGDAIQLAENESVRVDGKGWKRDVEAGAATGNAVNFVRLMPEKEKPSPDNVLAWFRMGDDDPDAAVGAVVNEGTIDHKGRCKLVRRGEPTYSAGEESMGGRFSVRFHSLKGEGFFGSDALCNIRNNFVIEAWAKVHKLPDSSTKIIAYNGRPGSDGFGLIVREGRWHYMFGDVGWFDSGVPVELGKWTHVALVYQWGSDQLWVNGRPAGEPVASWRPYPPKGTFFIGGNPSGLHLSIDAEIDEVRLSVLLERFRPEMLLYPASSVPRSLAGSDNLQGKNTSDLPKKETSR